MYYDNNTGMYYYYDAESGKYQFHSRIEVPTVQPVSETSQVKKSLDKKGRKWKKVPERTARQDDKVGDRSRDEPETLQENYSKFIIKKKD